MWGRSAGAQVVFGRSLITPLARTMNFRNIIATLALVTSANAAPSAPPPASTRTPAPAVAPMRVESCSGVPIDVRDAGASGSTFETGAVATAGAMHVTVADPGDFKPGHGVVVTGCNPHFERCVLKPPDNPYAATPLGDAAELRGYDGSGGSWLVFVLEINGVDPLTFRWSDDMARTWKGAKVPVTFDWQALGAGIEIRFARRQWFPGHMIAFQARDRLVTRIERIDGRTFTLAHPATRSTNQALVRHCDSDALQSAVDRALRERRNVFLPPGTYRLNVGLSISKPAGLVLEGAGGALTLLDISEGHGTCISLRGGTEATVRNLSMMGHTGLGDGPGWHSFRTSAGKACWPVGLKPCSAMHIRDTERVLVENCHASRMNCEAFYCQGASRTGTREPAAYTKSITYLHCSATDCDGNGFNNNDLAENTSVLGCRIVDVGGCTWEGASRFVRFIGNYVRNSGTVAMGNIRTRAAHLEELGSGQHIVADNVFEGRTFYNGRPGGYIVRATCGATQVIVRDNLFVNYNSSGIELVPGGDTRSLPTAHCAIRGNIMDMSAVGEPSRARTAIHVGSSGVTVADNQIYTRPGPDAELTAIRLTEPALDLDVHDNLVRNCGIGLLSDAAQSLVAEIVDPHTFVAGRGTVPLERRLSHRYRGWTLARFRGATFIGLGTIESFDPETLRFRLAPPLELKVDDRFEVLAPSFNWLIHDNTITGCTRPVALGSHGGPTSVFARNLITRGAARGVAAAIEVAGVFTLLNNHVSGFDEPAAAAIAFLPDPLRRAARASCKDNVFDRCTRAVAERPAPSAAAPAPKAPGPPAPKTKGK